MCNRDSGILPQMQADRDAYKSEFENLVNQNIVNVLMRYVSKKIGF